MKLLEPVDLLVPGVRAGYSTRSGGVSLPPYQSLNVATHVGDDDQFVATNRSRLAESLPSEPVWLDQYHSDRVIDCAMEETRQADGAYTRRSRTVLAVQVADCLPILLAAPGEIAAVHAGWRGLQSGIIGQGLDRFDASSREVTAWIGPGIGPCHYEVGRDVFSQFPDRFFARRDDEHWWFDLKAVARHQLEEARVVNISQSELCTHCREDLYSYRRDGVTGRIAALIWLE